MSTSWDWYDFMDTALAVILSDNRQGYCNPEAAFQGEFDAVEQELSISEVWA